VGYGWEIAPAYGSTVLAAGVDVGAIDDHGRLQSVTAFPDLTPWAR